MIERLEGLEEPTEIELSVTRITLQTTHIDLVDHPQRDNRPPTWNNSYEIDRFLIL